MTDIKKTHPLIKIINNSLVDLPAPINISAWWNFGSLLGLCLISQILTGILLAIHYTRDISLAFNRVVHIIRDVNYGWIIRFFHANGASFFFICLYLHVGRGIYYSSFFFFGNMKNRSNSSICSNRNCFYRICFTMRTNVFLGSNCHY